MYKLKFWFNLVYNQIIHLNKIIYFIIKHGKCVYIQEKAIINGYKVKDIMLNINPNLKELIEFKKEINNEIS